MILTQTLKMSTALIKAEVGMHETIEIIKMYLIQKYSHLCSLSSTIILISNRRLKDFELTVQIIENFLIRVNLRSLKIETVYYMLW